MGRWNWLKIALLLILMVVFAQVGPAIQPSTFVIDLVPASLGGEVEQDSEPCLAVDPNHPAHMLVTALTYSPSTDPLKLAPIYESTDNGQTWSMALALPVDDGETPVDLSVTASSNHFYASYIPDGSRQLRVVQLDGVLTSGGTASRIFDQDFSGDDQPFIEATSVATSEHVYVPTNQTTDAAKGRTATVTLLIDGAHEQQTIEARDTYNTPNGADGAPVRVAMDAEGHSYASFLGYRDSDSSSMRSGDVVVVRDLQGPVATPAYQDLKDPNDNVTAGVKVMTGLSLPDVRLVDQERIGGDLAFAVDPRSGHEETVYVAWLDSSGGAYTVHVYGSVTGGKTWFKIHDEISSAVCFDLAVASSGAVGLLYERLDAGNWDVHLEQSSDATYVQWTDSSLASIAASAAPRRVRFPYFGDFARLLAVDDQFRGVFSFPNNCTGDITYQRPMDPLTRTPTDSGNPVSASIDPFYFTVSVLP